MSNRKNKLKKRILITTSSILLTTGVVGSIAASQLSFATNSLDNSIKTVSDSKNVNLDNNISTYGNELPQISDSEIGKKVGGFTPFWNNNNNGFWRAPGWNDSQNPNGGYVYYQAPTMENFKPEENNHEQLTNPGVAMAWYPSALESGNFSATTKGGRDSAGPGLISFYTRNLEDYFYNNTNYQQIFYDDVQTEMFVDTFFGDINEIDPTAFIEFINDAVSPKKNYGNKATQDAKFGTYYKDGSVLSHLLFKNFTLNGDPSVGANAQLSRLMFYPSDNNPYTVKEDSNINTKYNTVWVGNEINQQGVQNTNNDPNFVASPTLDYTGKENSALMRALTLDSFDLVTRNAKDSDGYNAVGNIKFRIFYEYDFRGTSIILENGNRVRKNIYDINSLRYIPSPYITDYFEETPDGFIDVTKPKLDMIKKLILGNFDPATGVALPKEDNRNVVFKNINYNGSDKGEGGSYSIDIKESNIKIGDEGKTPPPETPPNGDGTGGGSKPAAREGETPPPEGETPPPTPVDYKIKVDFKEKTISFPVSINIQPELVNQEVIFQFHHGFDTGLLNTTINVASDPEWSKMYTRRVTEADAVQILQKNLQQIFQNLAPGCTIQTIKGFDNLRGLKDGKIYVSEIVIDKIYENGQVVTRDTKFTPTLGFVIEGFQKTENNVTQLSTNVLKTSTIDRLDKQTKFTKILPQTIWNATGKDGNDSVDINMINEFKQELINQKIVSNPDWADSLTINDFDIDIFDYDNTQGSLYLNVVLRTDTGNIYQDGQLLPSTHDNIQINNVEVKGFLLFKQTKPKSNIVIEDTINNTTTEKLFSTQMTIERTQAVVDSILSTKKPAGDSSGDSSGSSGDLNGGSTTGSIGATRVGESGGSGSSGTTPIDGIKTFLDNPIELLPNSVELSYNSWVLNTEIEIISISPNLLNGTVDVEAQMKNYQSQKSVVVTDENNFPFYFTLTGYYNYNVNEDKPFFTTVVSNGNLTYNGNKLPFLASSLKNPNDPSQQNNIAVTKRAIIEGRYIKNITIPQLTESDIDLDIVKVDDQNGSIQCRVIIKAGAQKSDQNGYQQFDENNPFVSQIVEYTGFTENNVNTGLKTNTLTINNDEFHKLVPSLTFNNLNLGDLSGTNMNFQTTSFVEFVRSQIIQNDVFENLNPVAPDMQKMDPADVLEITRFENPIDYSKENSVDSGSMVVYFKLKPPFVIENGIEVTDPLLIKEFKLTIRGFRALIPTSLPTTQIQEDIWSDIVKKQINVYQALSDPNYQENIKGIIKDASPEVMYPDINWAINPKLIVPLKSEDIVFNVPAKDVINDANGGSFVLEVTINKPWVDQSGNIITNQPYKSSISFSGFLTENKTTSLKPSINLKGFELSVASEFAKEFERLSNPANNLTPDDIRLKTKINNIIAQQLIDNGSIVNWTGSDISKLSVKDIELSYDSTCSFDNKAGTVNVKVKIKNNKALVNVNGVVQPQAEVDVGTISLVGFKKLIVTTIDVEAIKNAINPNQGEYDINYVINRLRNNDFADVKNAIINDPDVYRKFPFLKDKLFLNQPGQIEVSIENEVPFSPNGGSFVLNIKIHQDYVVANGNNLEIVKATPYPYIEKITITGFKNQDSTTTIVGGVLKGFDETSNSPFIASNVMNLSDEQQTLIAEQIINNKWIKNMTSGKTDIRPTDLVIKYAGTQSAPAFNNLTGTAKFDITILNGYGMVDGKEQNGPQGMTIYGVELGGFMKLTPTAITPIQISSTQIPSDFVKDQSAMYTMKEYILNNLETNMFPPGNFPTIDKISVSVIGNDDWNGQLTIQVTINSPYVRTDGTIADSPFTTSATLVGFSKTDNWVKENWYIIMIAAGGGLVIVILLILFLLRTIRRDRML